MVGNRECSRCGPVLHPISGAVSEKVWFPVSLGAIPDLRLRSGIWEMAFTSLEGPGSQEIPDTLPDQQSPLYGN